MSEITDSSLQTTEERILEAAIKEFAQKGYAGARTTAIAERAGVTHAMLHYYFRTKENLFEQIVRSKVELVRGILLDSLGVPDMPLFEKVEAVICRHLEFIAANQDMMHFVIREVFGQPERLSFAISAIGDNASVIVESLQRQIDDYAERGLCRRVDARMLMLDVASLNIFAFMASPVVNRMLGGVMEDRDAFLEMRKKENVETIMRKLRI